MGTLPPNELLQLWTREDMSAEMAIGHVLQHLVKIQTTLDSLNRAIATLRAEADAHPRQEVTKSPQHGRRNYLEKANDRTSSGNSTSLQVLSYTTEALSRTTAGVSGMLS